MISASRMPCEFSNELFGFKGWEGNIMGNNYGKPDNRNIQELMKKVWGAYDEWKSKGNNGEFIYEINP